LLGSKPHVVQRAAAVLSKRYPQHLVVGQRDGYFDEGMSEDIAGEIRRSAADVVLVAMGNPKQEIWLARHLEATGCKLGFAVGALFDFMAMEVRRAPAWVQTCRLEWLYRLCQEPARLWTRYIVGNPKFLTHVLFQWWSGARI
jgi:alpha-1,3-mannosyltransferase